jgi:hypothetical protein
MEDRQGSVVSFIGFAEEIIGGKALLFRYIFYRIH